ncbi:MAG: DUF4065 domain-containing protein, partial [Candidatus Pacearchaeota archaeon]
MEKLRQVIYYILKKSANGRSRIDLSKLTYYCDAVYVQHHGTTITQETYLHLEDSPQALSFFHALSSLIKEGLVEVRLKVENGKIGGFELFAKGNLLLNLEREEKRIINKVLSNFPSKVIDEYRHYPNLYETYVVSPMFSEIPLKVESVNTKIHFHKKKSLLSLSGK